MKVLILAAGRGSRMGELTENVPKPLIEWRGKSLLKHKLDALSKEVTKVGIAVYYKAEAVIEHIGHTYTKSDGTTLPIEYIHLTCITGTGDAVRQSKDFIGSDSVLVLMGDDVYAAKDLADLCDDAVNNRWSMLFYVANDDSFTFTGACSIGPDIFKIEPVAIKAGTETGLPQTIAELVTNHDQKVNIRFTREWRKMNKPEDLLD